MRQLIKEYLSFSRKERVAVIALLAVILAAYFLPYFIKQETKEPSAKEIAEWKMADSAVERTDDDKHDKPAVHSPPARLFYFDPNTISQEGWKQLGLRAKTIGTILKYLSKGGHFYNPADLKKIYGLHAGEFERLEPYIRILSKKKDPSYVEVHKPPAYKKPLPRIIDINAADTSAFIALPGIGGKLAARIIAFREKLGGFYSIDQIGETYGLPDSTFQKIRPFLALPNSPPRRLNPNTATLEALKQHPYIKWNLAAAIIRYREQHGPFASLEQLQQLAPLTPELYHKIAPYLSLSDQ